jgi:hypothetical protein
MPCHAFYHGVARPGITPRFAPSGIPAIFMMKSAQGNYPQDGPMLCLGSSSSNGRNIRVGPFIFYKPREERAFS